jgi:hypothetical protein
MNTKSVKLLTVLLFCISCSKDSLQEENIIIQGKDLHSITYVLYNYLYPDQPATRTYTTNYVFSDNRIATINTSTFHFFYEDPSRNRTDNQESTLFYDDQNNLINVEEAYYYSGTLTSTLFYVFDYDESNRLTTLTIKNDGGSLTSEHFFTYENNTIKRKQIFYQEESQITYQVIHENTYYIDSQQRIYRMTSKGPIFPNTDPNSVTETSLEAIFNDGNLYKLLFNGSPYEEYHYTDIKIPSGLQSVTMPTFTSNPYHILLAPFDKIAMSYNTNYLSLITPLNPTNTTNIIFKNTLSKDKYPLRLEDYWDDRIRSETIYTYE